MAINTNEIAATTVQHIMAELPDALMKANALWQKIANEQAMYVSGGTNIQFPVKLIPNAAQGFISGGAAAVNVNPSQQNVYGTLNWKYFNSNVSFTLEDFTQTQDAKEAVLDFIEAKKNGGLMDAIRALTVALHGSATTDPQSFNGLKDVVAASGTAYAGLLDTDYATGSYLPLIDGTTQVVSYENIAPSIQKIKARVQQFGENAQYPIDMGFANAAVMGAFMASEQAKQRFYESTMLSTGFEGMKVNGINLYLDDNTPGTQDGSTADNFLYIFPSKAFKMAYKYGLKGKTSPLDGEVRIPNQPVMSNQSYFAGNLVCPLRRSILVFKTLVA